MDLHPGEQVIFHGHPSWRSTLGYYLKGLVLALVAAAIAAGVTRATGDEVDKGIVIAVFLVLLALAILVGFIRRVTTTYSITSQRLRIKKGLVARRVQQTRIERVQNVNTDQSVLDRLLQVGTVDFDTAGTDDSDFKFIGVSDPQEVVDAVDRAQRAAAAEAEHSGSGL
ncbi:MAG TPA: PH domain-containing protein [Solirubrobacteraceae bacterium]|jgi:uncharacterized membrane protein YdbT with pleckstrin-like domain